MKPRSPLEHFGMMMFFVSWPVFGVGFLVPFFGLSLAQGSMVAGGFFLLAEILFWGSLLILGKPTVQSFNDKLKFWRSKSGDKK